MFDRRNQNPMRKTSGVARTAKPRTNRICRGIDGLLLSIGDGDVSGRAQRKSSKGMFCELEIRKVKMGENTVPPLSNKCVCVGGGLWQ